MKILILSPYTTGQKYKPDTPLQREDTVSPERLNAKIKELCGYNAEGWYHEDRDYTAPAGEMFTGPMHTQLREGLRHIREHEGYGETTLDLYFPWYACRVDGRKTPVGEKDTIVPFDIAPLHDTKVLKLGETGVPEAIATLIDRYDLVFSLLRQEDIISLQRVFEMQRSTPLVFLLAPSHRHVVNESLSNVHVIETGRNLAKAIRATNWSIKGVVVRRLCEAACRDGFHVFAQVKQDPQQLLEIIQNQ
ncbi:hypothetical protein F4Y59_07140 [Candidatus Poribacteria bacterium]|nr:hypothetical protein [Candidatus Poribacteria bacterium]MYK18258.1 hypothetical protein [Candidatus Poribacteria bacterium]